MQQQQSSVLAWHFLYEGNKMRDGKVAPADGVPLHFAGEPIPCEQGLHASLQPFDALQYAPGAILCLVRCAGTIVYTEDKIVCTERTIVARMDATELLRYFARMQALSVVHLWDAPDVVLDYLMTADESIRTAARTAARAAAWAAWSAAQDAVRDAAWAAARDAAREAARAAAWSAARAAARKEFNKIVEDAFKDYLT